MEKYVLVVEIINNFIGRGRHPYFVDVGYIRQHLFKSPQSQQRAPLCQQAAKFEVRAQHSD
jgi:hypothetical protein